MLDYVNMIRIDTCWSITNVVTLKPLRYLAIEQFPVPAIWSNNFFTNPELGVATNNIEGGSPYPATSDTIHLIHLVKATFWILAHTTCHDYLPPMFYCGGTPIPWPH